MLDPGTVDQHRSIPIPNKQFDGLGSSGWSLPSGAPVGHVVRVVCPSGPSGPGERDSPRKTQLLPAAKCSVRSSRTPQKTQEKPRKQRFLTQKVFGKRCRTIEHPTICRSNVGPTSVHSGFLMLGKAKTDRRASVQRRSNVGPTSAQRQPNLNFRCWARQKPTDARQPNVSPTS